MSITTKSWTELEKMHRACKVVVDTLDALERAAQPGVRTKELDRIAYEKIVGAGARPAFLGYRDYELEKHAYEDLAGRLHSATIAENVERNRRGEQFNVLYTASYPTEPTKPIPLRVMLISVVVGIVLGGALTLGREYLDRSVHDVRDLKDQFELPVLGEIARIQTA